MRAPVLAIGAIGIDLHPEMIGEISTAAERTVLQELALAAGGDLVRQRGAPRARDLLADQVDHPAHVVRSVLHGRTATHDVDAVDLVQPHREQRQAGLPIRGQRQWNAVFEHLHATAAAFVQAAQHQLRQRAGAGFVEDLDARHALQSIVQRTVAAIAQLLAVDHLAAAGVTLHIVGFGAPEQAALHLDRIQRANRRTANARIERIGRRRIACARQLRQRQRARRDRDGQGVETERRHLRRAPAGGR